ncbi:protein-tyrosine phosphatase family protein [Glycomyces paridis]|uniref:Protein phosphatase n=1 Tax=Glycomyces paridis TaxID=2126555 RepID=A0A4S8PPB5_9ACTN|nr:protein phosphatase [Glycomyces paridis]THV32041.1 protein phosphatase [Glycomyces paridis]
MTDTWDPAAPGVMRLPSGRLVRGRPLARPLPEGPAPQFALYLLGKEPPAVPWESEWIRWPDFRLPSDKGAFPAALARALDRTTAERVEFACHGGNGRTGTALACLAILDGLPAPEALAYVRTNYARTAVETPGQKRFIKRFG